MKSVIIKYRYVFGVVLPTILAAVYLVFFASAGYISRAELVVEVDSPTVPPDLAAGVLGLVSSPSSKVDALIVKAFMRSRAMLDYLDGQVDLRSHFSAGEVDFIRRMPASASGQEFLDYFRSHLDIQVDEQSYIINVEFSAYDPNIAHDTLEALVDRAERFVNDISQYLAREQMKFVEENVKRARERLDEASREMVKFQQKYDVFSPEKETEAAGEIIAALLQELTKQRTRLKELESYLSDDSAKVITTKQRINALEQQLSQERMKLVGEKMNTQGLNELLSEYKDAEVALKVAAEVYKTSIASLESTRLDMARKSKYLVGISAPSIADEAELPRAGYWILTIFVVLNFVYFVLALAVATIRDHKE